jgi:acyl carrier protein
MAVIPEENHLTLADSEGKSLTAVTPEENHLTLADSEGKSLTAVTPEQIRTALAEIVEEVTDVPADSVQMDKSFIEDLEIDSLSMVEIVVTAEEKFGVKIPDESLKDLSTVAGAVEYIQQIIQQVEAGT